MLDDEPERARALVELEDRILERALGGEAHPHQRREVRERYGVPQEVLDRLEQLEVLTPTARGYSPSDIRIIEAIAASAPAATTSRSASPSTTPCATRAPSKSWSARRSRW